MPVSPAGNWVKPVFPVAGNVSSTKRNPGPLCQLRFSSKLNKLDEIARKNPKQTKQQCSEPGFRLRPSGLGCLRVVTSGGNLHVLIPSLHLQDAAADIDDDFFGVGRNRGGSGLATRPADMDLSGRFRC